MNNNKARSRPGAGWLRRLYSIEFPLVGGGTRSTGEHVSIIDAVAAFHILSVALSDIRCHTTATLAHINLFCDTQMFAFQIPNPIELEMSIKLCTTRPLQNVR